jgi:putative tryptophan/tyrosine transport system substrate-binding protein
MASHIGRRKFLATLGGGAVAWPLAASAQHLGKVPLVGALIPFAEGDEEAERRRNAFQRGLEAFSWTNGQNIRIEYRWVGSDPNRIRSYAADIVGLAPDVILANATPVLAAIRQETRTIPIVFVQVIDPVSRGFVKSLAQPGGNVTGFTNFEFPMGGKWVEVLKEVAPRITSIAVVFNPDTAPYGEPFFQQITTSASSLSIEAIEARVRNVVELEKAVAGIAAKSNGSLIVLPDTFTTVHRDSIIALADLHQLPGVYPFRYFATRGGLVSYGVDAEDMFRRSASYIDRILKGEKPADLPVQAPTKYELVINLKTAKALGLEVPPTLLARADEVIE